MRPWSVPGSTRRYVRNSPIITHLSLALLCLSIPAGSWVAAPRSISLSVFLPPAPPSNLGPPPLLTGVVRWSAVEELTRIKPDVLLKGAGSSSSSAEETCLCLCLRCGCLSTDLQFLQSHDAQSNVLLLYRLAACRSPAYWCTICREGRQAFLGRIRLDFFGNIRILHSADRRARQRWKSGAQMNRGYGETLEPISSFFCINVLSTNKPTNQPTTVCNNY